MLFHIKLLTVHSVKKKLKEILECSNSVRNTEVSMSERITVMGSDITEGTIKIVSNRGASTLLRWSFCIGSTVINEQTTRM